MLVNGKAMEVLTILGEQKQDKALIELQFSPVHWIGTGKRKASIGTVPARLGWAAAGFSAVTVSIGSFEVSRCRDGRGDLPEGFEWAPDGISGCRIGEVGRIVQCGL